MNQREEVAKEILLISNQLSYAHLSPSGCQGIAATLETAASRDVGDT